MIANEYPEPLSEQLRKMRRELTEAAYGRVNDFRYDPIDGIVRAALIIGEREGLSMEDTMMMLAHDLRKRCKELNEISIRFAQSVVERPLVVSTDKMPGGV